MRHQLITRVTAVLAVAVFQSPASAQGAAHVPLHVNHNWKECSIQLDPSLTQAAWRQFTQEAGLLTYFRPLAGAKPMGAGQFEVSAMQWTTGIDDGTSAWNDTFVHPDADHWLFEGSGLSFPGLMVRGGVTDRVDVGAYYTRNPNANYGFYGAQVQYNLANDATRNWAASARVSMMSLFGPDDVDMSVYGLDLVASREYPLFARWAALSPYAGVSAYRSSAHEKSAAVDLADERVLGGRGMVGANLRMSVVNVAFEVSTARVNSRSLKIGVAF